MPEQESNKVLWYIAAGLVGFVLLGRTCHSPPAEHRQAPQQSAADAAKANQKQLALMACVAAQREVKAKLKAPATADFPDCVFKAHEYKINANPEMTKFGVQGYVDSENTFGANIRSRYVVMLNKGAGNGSSDFTLDDIAIE